MIERQVLRAAVLALLLVPAAPAALGQQGAKKAAPDKPAPEKSVAPPVIGCPSLANYRMLMRQGAAAAAATLADPKADHLGCAALARARITGTAERVALGGKSYTCAAVQGTTACHWMEAATPDVTGAAAGAGR